MRFFNRLYIGPWDSREKFIGFEYLNGKNSCGCKFLTIFNVLFMCRAKDCEW